MIIFLLGSLAVTKDVDAIEGLMRLNDPTFEYCGSFGQFLNSPNKPKLLSHCLEIAKSNIKLSTIKSDVVKLIHMTLPLLHGNQLRTKFLNPIPICILP